MSGLVHMILLISLALWSISSSEENFPTSINSSIDSDDVEFDELIDELDSLEVEPPEVNITSLPTDVIDPGLADLGDVAKIEPEVMVEAGVLSGLSSLDEIGALFGDSGDGMASTGLGKGGAAFFGARSRGRRFVFVVDNSNSMTKGRFETALNELVKTVDAMDEQQQFFVIFFSDTAYSLFHPYPAKSFVSATYENKQKLRQWLRTVQLCLQTRGEQAVIKAMALNPDAIYILGDGRFTDKTVNLIEGNTVKLKKLGRRPIPIHALGMEVDSRGEEELQTIAKVTGGTYRRVGVHPAAVVMAQRNPIPRNNRRGPVWGIALSPGGPQKKPKAQGGGGRGGRNPKRGKK